MNDDESSHDSEPPRDPAGVGWTSSSLVSPLAMAFAFFLLIAGLLIGSCDSN